MLIGLSKIKSVIIKDFEVHLYKYSRNFVVTVYNMFGMTDFQTYTNYESANEIFEYYLDKEIDYDVA